MAQAAETHTAVWRVKAIIPARVNRVKIETLIKKPCFVSLQQSLLLSAGREEGNILLWMFDSTTVECFTAPSTFLIKENH